MLSAKVSFQSLKLMRDMVGDHYKYGTPLPKLYTDYYNANYRKHCTGIWAKTFSSSGGGKISTGYICKDNVILIHHFVSSTYHTVHHWASNLESTCSRHAQHVTSTGWACNLFLQPFPANTIIIIIIELAPCLLFIPKFFS